MSGLRCFSSNGEKHCPLLDYSNRVSSGQICPNTGHTWAAASVAGPYWGLERAKLRGDENAGNPTNRTSWNWHVCHVTSLQIAQKNTLILSIISHYCKEYIFFPADNTAAIKHSMSSITKHWQHNSRFN